MRNGAVQTVIRADNAAKFAQGGRLVGAVAAGCPGLVRARPRRRGNRLARQAASGVLPVLDIGEAGTLADTPNRNLPRMPGACTSTGSLAGHGKDDTGRTITSALLFHPQPVPII